VKPGRFLPVMLLLFVGGGCAAFIYEVVWFQLLELVIGSSAVSMGVLLGTFMGGMCLGSLLMPHAVSSRRHPLQVYAALELGIGIIGLAVLYGMPLVGRIYTAWAGTGAIGILIRGLAAAACLLPPTMLMGATLPAIARWIEASPRGVAWLGFFYGGNTAGAVVGSLLAGYYLLRVHDIAFATYVAVALNVVVAVVALAVAARAPHSAASAAARTAPPVPDQWPVFLAIALSGLTALACEVLWTRTLSLLFGATVYTFSLILAVFLAGLGIGSSLGSVLARGPTRPRIALAWCQLALAAAMAWTSYVLTDSLPFWPINPSLAPVAAQDRDPARLVGGVYAANTLGAIVGALGASLLLVVWLGTQRSQQLLIVLAASSGLVLLWRDMAAMRRFAVPVVAAGFLAFTVHPVPGMLIAYGRYVPSQMGQSEVIYTGEGWNASVAVSERSNGVLNYHNAGKVQASSEPQDMRLQRMLGHLTTLVPANPARVVVIGCGAGVTAGAVSIDPTVEHETIAEIEPLVPQVVSAYFSEHNFAVVSNPKVNIHIDDARHFLQTTSERFDAITSDPLDPWVKGAAMLYTREFFELTKSRLNPGGVVTLFVQLYESNTEAVKSEIGTFFEAFPNGMVFANTYNGAGYDLVLLGQVEATQIDIDEMEARLKRPEYGPVAKSLRDIGMSSATDLFATYAGSAKDFEPWLKDAQINRDRNLRLQYLAGQGLNLYRADAIYADMLNYAQAPPVGLFVGSPDLVLELRRRILVAQGRE
jgi:spermidine synthase